MSGLTASEAATSKTHSGMGFLAVPMPVIRRGLVAAELWISITPTSGNGARHWKDMDAKAAKT